MKGKHKESLSLRLFNNGKDVKMEKENKGISHTSFEVQRKKKKKLSKNLSSHNILILIAKCLVRLLYSPYFPEGT